MPLDEASTVIVELDALSSSVLSKLKVNVAECAPVKLACRDKTLAVLPGCNRNCPPVIKKWPVVAPAPPESVSDQPALQLLVPLLLVYPAEVNSSRTV